MLKATWGVAVVLMAGIDAKARLPHPLGLDAFVLPGASENVKSAGLLTEII
jgi:hypothetical protein